MNELIGVQYLRGIAALAVVYFHVLPRVLGKASEDTFAVGILSAGVDVFFVLSGFIIWLTTQRPGVTPGAWWRARLIRVVPLYWFALLATLAFRLATGTGHIPGFVEGLKAFLFIPVAHSKDGQFYPFLIPGWTLNYEFFFYVVVACTLFLRTSAQRLIALVLVFGTLIAFRKFADTTSAIQFRMTSPLFLEFLAGIAVAIVHKRFSTNARVRFVIGLGSLAAAIAFASMISPRLFDAGPRTVYFGVPAALLVLGVICLEEQIRRLPVRPLKLLGDASYSLYLIHPLVIWPAEVLVQRTVGQSAIAELVVVPAACIAVAILTFKFVEQPMLASMRARIVARPALAAA
ncbi:acyltransferase family protein [Aquincola tertiaricarbonis]|uniref:acyltransferase family protein n=1 Tax=Aquincola tertiaricarbonis TaxID=391953 RepID=UPI000614C8DD|nr:acyltransferase [Aquincola tertiaricarbonis]